MNRTGGLYVLLIVFGTTVALTAPHASALRESPPHASWRATTPGAATKLRPLVIAGFRGDEQLDTRDAWIPTAVEETLAWRLRRVPGLTVVPTVRAHRARRELAESHDDPPAEWSRVVRLLGAKLWLTGTCTGTPDALIINLDLIETGQPAVKPAQIRLGPGRTYDVIDEATRWALSRLGVARIDDAADRLILAPPSASLSALEYYAKALTAARSENLRDGAYYVEQAVACDAGFRPALMLMAKIELRGPAATRRRAGVHLRRVRQLAADCGDALDEAEFELNQGLLLMMTRSFDPARQRLESALATAFERNDLHGQLAAMNSLCELWCQYQPPTRSNIPQDALRRFKAQKLRRAAEWQMLVLEMLRRLGDVVAEVPAANKLALIHEQLDDQESALEAHQRTVAAAEKTGSARSQATAWLFLGQWYRRQERWQPALEATSRCLALATDEAKPAIRITLAEIYRGMSLPREALGQYQSAYAGLADGENLIGQSHCLRGIAELRMELGERQAAIGKLTEALGIAEALELPEEGAIRQQLEQWRGETP